MLYVQFGITILGGRIGYLGKGKKNNNIKISNGFICSGDIREIYYPNPCNPSTTFNMDIPIAGNVQVKVYDAMGREISTLVDKYMDVGTYNVKFDGKNLPTGTYIYRMVSGSFIKTGKILLMK
jgi:hypothetical protein